MASKYAHAGGRRAHTEMPLTNDEAPIDINKLEDQPQNDDEAVDLNNYKGIYANEDNSQKY